MTRHRSAGIWPSPRPILTSTPTSAALSIGAVVSLQVVAILRPVCAALGLAACGVVAASVSACAPSPSRADVIQNVLAADARDLALRDPREVEARFARMATDPFSFLRGSVVLWASDLSTPGAPGAIESAFVDGVAGASLIVGDAHPENIGTSRRDDGAIVLGFNDYDAARFGPVVLDLRRLATAFVIAATVANADFDAFSIVDAVVAGYADGMVIDIHDVVSSGDLDVDEDSVGVIAADLFRRASRDGEARTELELTVTDDTGAHRLPVVSAPPEDLEAEVFLALAPGDERRLREALAAVRHTPTQIVRVVGRGVGSRAQLRYVAVDDDGGLFQLKEARDSFVLPSFVGEHERFFDDNAERIVFSRRTLLGGAHDLALGAVPLDPLALVMSSETGFHKTFRVSRMKDKIIDGDFVVADVYAFARLAGVMLAHHHRRGVSVDGDPIADRLPRDLGLNDEARVAALIDETVAVVVDSMPTALDDHALLQERLYEVGPLLGLQPAEATP